MLLAKAAGADPWSWVVREFPRLFTQLDGFLLDLAKAVGSWTYAVLFAIVFCETGLVVTPFLPGDSLLFAAGALCAVPELGLRVDGMAVLLFIAAVLGDAVNYHIGRWIGPPAFTGRFRFLNPAHLQKTREFFERHGGKAVVLARFVPIVRTFAPFVAGVGTMSYRRFFLYNVVGAIVWVGLFLAAGYLFGNLPFVKRNFSKVILAIIVVSVLPIVWEWWKHRRVSHKAHA
ncbi:MAG: DedA family protein [Planctomycetes bacterium]|nr:DedA family protein [Planctomycetota bacterium]